MEGHAATSPARHGIASMAEDSLHKGDTVLLQAGDLIPADLELLEARSLQVDEWELTGELRPVEKRVGQQAVYLYKGSRVTRGSGKGIVVATGAETEYGETRKQLWEQEKRRPPLLIKGKHCLLLVLLLPPFIAAWGRYDNDALVLLAFMAVAAVMVVLQNHDLFRYLLTSIEAKRLEARGIDVRDTNCLDVVSQLDVVCLDKTGVLTALDIQVGGIYFADEIPDPAPSLLNDERGALTGIACALCNDVFFLERQYQADPIDRALISFALQHGFDIDQLLMQYKRVYDKPFDSEDRYMAAGFERGDQRLYFAKGDPEVIVRMCAGYMTTSGDIGKVDGVFFGSIRSTTDSVNQQGDIAIALAYSPNMDIPTERYTFLCLIQLENPVRPGVHAEMRKLKNIGIRPIMLTGDRPEAAVAVARMAGIGPDPKYCLTGKDIAKMALQEVATQAAYVSIFARLLPSQKGVLVRLLQQRGHLVAMVGDGTNDTIALRAADVGFSFGESSSPFAKRVSKILIRDLADFLTVVIGAKRMERLLKYLTLLRFIALISVLYSLYAWMLS